MNRNVKLKPRKQVDRRDYFSTTTPALKVTANPVSSYSLPSVSGMSNTSEVINELFKTLGLYDQMQETNRTENEKKAEQDFNKGVYDKKQSLLNAAYGYDEKYNKLKAEAMASKMWSDVEGGLKKADYFSTEENPVAKVEEFITEKYNDYFGDNNTLGQEAAHYITQLRVKAVEKAIATKQNKVMEEIINNANDVIQHTILDSYLGDGNLNDPVQVKKTIDGLYSEYLKDKPFIKRDVFSGMVIDTLLNRAKEEVTDNPESAVKILKILTARTPDGSWVDLRNRDGSYKFKDKIEQGIKQVETLLNKAEKAKAVQLKQQKKQEITLLKNSFIAALSEVNQMETPEERVKAATRIRDQIIEAAMNRNNPLPPDYTKSLLKIADEVVATNGYRKTSNETVYRDLLFKIYNGDEGVLNEIAANSELLSHNDLNNLLGRYNSEIENSRKKTQFKSFWANVKNELKSGRFFNWDNTDFARVRYGFVRMNEEIDKHISEHNNPPTVSEMDKMFEKVKQEAYRIYKPIVNVEVREDNKKKNEVQTIEQELEQELNSLN